MSKQQNPLHDRARQGAAQMEEAITEVSSSVAVLRTETDRARGLFGFGQRILVPPDEIHVVVGDGRHVLSAAKERGVFGQIADRPSRYWLNPLTQVIKLKTISFTVSIRGVNDEGVEALDTNKVSFRLWAHAVAKLNPERADIAAQRVGLDTTSLVKTITQVGTAALVEVSATMALEDIIANRNKLATDAFPKVNDPLAELGYDLALLTITKLDGLAYKKLIEQAESRVSKETTIATNLEQLAELQDRQARERTEAEIQAVTQEKLASEQLEAQEKIETATLQQQETLNIRRHEVELQQIDRDRTQAEADHKTELAKVQLAQQLGQAEASKAAQLAELKAQREAELRAKEQKRNAELELAQSQANAERVAYEQVREIERAAERTEAENKRLKAQELASAQRTKEVAVLEANQLAEAIEIEAQGQANALELKVTAETKAEQIKADAEANATEKRAQAAKIRAEATRAEAAAPGLAEAEVETARVEVAEKRVAVTRAEGLTQVEVAQAQATAEADRLQRLKDVEINAQKELVALYDEAPVLVELEKIRLEYEHTEKIATMQTEAYLRAFEAIAPGIQVHIYGNGGQASRILTDVMSLARGVHHLGEEVPAMGRLLEGVNGTGPGLNPNGWSRLMPYLQEALAGVNPRMFSSLKISDLLDRLGPVVAGEEDLVSALNNLKQDANFRVVGDMPVGPLLKMLGLNLPDEPVLTNQAKLSTTDDGEVAA